MQKQIINWYRLNKRSLPWRTDKNPYRIWISEVMLQQTTVISVLPYYDKFMTKFPTLKSLAKASTEEVLEYWAGLGYYSRARNLHKAAIQLDQQGFPHTSAELIQFPGFGPYTSRAVSSLAFDEKVGVLDGNVIRVLTRFYNLKVNWWMPKEKEKLQQLADNLAKIDSISDFNQGVMELGATICTPKKPLCLLCPIKKNCLAFANGQVEKLPLAKPKSEKETWVWKMNVVIKQGKIFLIKNNATPFLSGLMFPPSEAVKLKAKPVKFDISHSVTKYKIYIQLSVISNSKTTSHSKASNPIWVKTADIKKTNPSSLMIKILKKLDK